VSSEVTATLAHTHKTVPECKLHFEFYDYVIFDLRHLQLFCFQLYQKYKQTTTTEKKGKNDNEKVVIKREIIASSLSYRRQGRVKTSYLSITPYVRICTKIGYILLEWHGLLLRKSKPSIK